MTNFPQGFPFGKSMWLWELWECVGKKKSSDVTPQDIQTIINKLKENDVQVALVKCGDGSNTWDQFNPALIKAFHDAGLKIFSWSFVYGQDPVREGNIANWALDMGADGHIFDAEGNWESLANPGETARTMLKTVRDHLPHAVLGHSPEPIIDFHQNFPYVEFGEYCDFVMPQVYFGEWDKSPNEGVQWMYDNWSRWQKTWRTNGFESSIKPIIPVCQAYDDYSKKPPFVVNPVLINQFIQAVAGYKAVSFWSYQHIIRNECWEAVRDGKIDSPTLTDIADNNKQNEQTTTPSNPEPAAPVVEPTLQGQNEANTELVDPPQSPTSPVSDVNGTGKPYSIDLSKGPTEIPIPDGNTTIHISNPADQPPGAGVQVKVTHHTAHIIIFKNFLASVVSGLRSIFGKKGGVKN